MKLIKQIFLVLALLVTPHAFAAPEAGKGYTLINPPQPISTGKKIEVLEFFFYGCGHCFKLHPLLSNMEKKMPKDVELVYMPTIFSNSMEPMARTFYSLEFMGQRSKLHDALFNAWNVDNIDLSDEARITEFVAQRGVDRKKFGDAYNAFAMQSKVTRSKQLAQSYGIRGVPTLIVDGKYMITGLRPEEAMLALDAALDQARKERAGKR